jgi:hypothetical protein
MYQHELCTCITVLLTLSHMHLYKCTPQLRRLLEGVYLLFLPMKRRLTKEGGKLPCSNLKKLGSEADKNTT